MGLLGLHLGAAEAPGEAEADVAAVGSALADGENAKAYRILFDGEKVGGLVLRIEREKAFVELELLFVNPEIHSKGIGQAAWKAV